MRKILVTAFFVILAVPLSAQDFDRGVAAYKRGDYVAAMKEWRPLAEQGNEIAQYALGVMYDLGVGASQDLKTTVQWYKLSAEQGYALAQYNLGIMYELGAGVSKNSKEAVKW